MLAKCGFRIERKVELLGDFGPKLCAPTEFCQEGRELWFLVSHFAIVSQCLLTPLVLCNLRQVCGYRLYLGSDLSFLNLLECSNWHHWSPSFGDSPPVCLVTLALGPSVLASYSFLANSLQVLIVNLDSSFPLATLDSLLTKD